MVDQKFKAYVLTKLSISDKDLSPEEFRQKIETLITEYVIKYDESIPKDIPDIAQKVFDALPEKNA